MVQSVRKSLELLTMISEAPHPVTLTEMSASLRINIATCSHIVTTMRESGYVKRVGRREGYVLGIRAYLLGGNSDAVKRIADIIKPETERFYNVCGEQLVFAMMIKGVRWVICGSLMGGEPEIRCEDNIDAFSVPTMSLLLACASDAEIESYTALHGKFGKSERELLRSLKNAEIYAPETRNGIYHVAIPLRLNGKVVASLGSYFPSVRDTMAHRNELTDQLRESAKIIATLIG